MQLGIRGYDGIERDEDENLNVYANINDIENGRRYNDMKFKQWNKG